MKKILPFIFILILAGQVFAGGTAYVSPQAVARDTNSVSLTFTYTPAYGDGWSNGKVSILVPEGFNPEPLTITPYSGQITAVIMRSGTISEPVPASNIAIDGRAVTITALTFSANDYMTINYGLVDTGNSFWGLNTPMTQGDFIFYMHEAPSGNVFSPLSAPPKVSVNSLKLAKSAAASTAYAGLTFTYTLTVSNLSALHGLDTISVWDSLPAGIKPIGSNIPFATQSLSFVSWDIGNILSAGSTPIQLYCEVQPGIRKHGASAVNEAGAYAKDMYTNEYRSEAEAELMTSGPVLNAYITAAPDAVVYGQKITVVMKVSNTGNASAYAVSPAGTLGSSGTGAAMLLTGPLPATQSMLSAGGTAYFTWVFQASYPGVMSYTGKASATEGGKTIETGLTDSNQVTVLIPTPTSTATPIVPTATNTAVQPSATNTAVVTEPTSTPVVINTPVVIPASVEGGNVFTDKNYIKQGSGDKIRIFYEVPQGGKLEITVFNLSGERIRYFTRTYTCKQADYMEWDGKNDALKQAGKGIYFVHVKMGSWSKMKKVVILK